LKIKQITLLLFCLAAKANAQQLSFDRNFGWFISSNADAGLNPAEEFRHSMVTPYLTYPNAFPYLPYPYSVPYFSYPSASLQFVPPTGVDVTKTVETSGKPQTISPKVVDASVTSSKPFSPPSPSRLGKFKTAAVSSDGIPCSKIGR
jgi:hypothetical protein